MKNKKGFTLIELLAVIVILAIIALIATPIILNMINNARKSASIDSAYGYIEAIEFNNSMAQMDNKKYTLINDGTDIDITTIEDKVKLKGTRPTSGSINIEKGKVGSANLCINGYEVNYQNNVATVVKKCNETIVKKEYINLSGVLTDSSNNPLSNKLIVVFSDTPHYSLTTSSGYFYVENLKIGQHELYYLDKKLTDVKNMNKEEIKNNAIASSNFNTEDNSISIENIRINNLKISEDNELKEGEIWNFDYTGDEQLFNISTTGYYLIETWGAQGGSYSETVKGGNGAYAKGKIKLNKNEKIYIYVGEQGKLGNNGSTFNGGGTGFDAQYKSGSGGGATDIRYFESDNPTDDELKWDSEIGLKSRIMVAAGGGGSSWNAYNGGAAGAYLGYSGEVDARISNKGATGGTQIEGGKLAYVSGWGTTPTNGSFGLGGIGSKGNSNTYCNGGGGGSGWYGGGGGGSGYSFSGAGGSSYISGHPGCIGVDSTGIANNSTYENKEDSYSYNNKIFNDTVIVDGKGYKWVNSNDSTLTGMQSPITNETINGNTGNGYAKITYLGK